MPASTSNLIPALLLPWFAWRMYRRFHRNVGRQPLHSGRLISGIVIFGLISVSLLAVTWPVPRLLAGFGGGLVLGGLLALVGLHLTVFATNPGGPHFYTPNTYIGVGLSLLLAGRVLYRIGVLYFSDAAVTASSAAFMQSPLTLLMIGLTAGYYLAYNTGVLIRSRR
jgi:hypothetical protein